MYLLAHAWVQNRLAASVAGVAFAFNGLTWHALMWPNNIAALGWMPLVAFTVQRACREGGRQVVVAAVVGAMQMLAGAPEIVGLTWMLLMVLCASETVKIIDGKFQITWSVPGRFLLVVVSIAGLSAAQLLPFFDLLAHSQRDVAFGDAEWAMPGDGLANLLVPLFHCYRSFHGVFVQYGQYWTTSYYLGVGVVLLTLLAVWRVRERRAWVLTGVAALSFILAMGEQGFFYGLLRRIAPQVGFMRFPIKFVVLPVFILPLLAAYAVGWFRARPEADRQDRGRRMTVVAVVLLGLILIVVGVAGAHPMPDDDRSATWNNALVRAMFLALIGGALLAVHYVRRTQLQWLSCLSLLAALWFDIRTHAPDLNPTVDRSVYEPGLVRAAVKFDPEPRHGGSRAMVSPAALARLRHLSVSTPKDEVLGRRLALYGNCNLLDDIPKVNGFYSLYLRETEEVLSLLYPSPRIELPRLVDFLNVAHVTATNSLLEWATRSSFLSLVTAGPKPVFADERATLLVLRDPAFDPKNAVYLPPAAAAAITVTNRTTANVVSGKFTAHRVELEVDAREPSLLVLAQAYYHPWKAYVDGAATNLWRANHAFQALEVPAGRHRVRLAYEDRQFHRGAIISGVTLFVCAAVWFWRRHPLTDTSGSTA